VSLSAIGSRAPRAAVGAGDEAAESDPPQAAASGTRPGFMRARSAAQGAPSRQNLILMIGPKMMIRSWRGRLLAACAVCVAVAVVTKSHSVPAADLPAADDLMLRLMSMDNVSGVALALIRDGRIVLEKGYGFRGLESHARVTTATLFNIGSISKSFTALGIAQLVDQQQVELDTPVIKYIPDLRLTDPRAAQVVTLRQLLSHTSGLPPDEHWRVAAWILSQSPPLLKVRTARQCMLWVSFQCDRESREHRRSWRSQISRSAGCQHHRAFYIAAFPACRPWQ